MNEAYNGQLKSQQADIGDSGMLDVTTTDAYIAVVPFGPSPGYTGPNWGKFQVVGNFAFWHPNPFCFPMVPPGIPAYVDEVGTEWIFGYTRDFDTGNPVDPTPVIESITLTPPLVSGGTSTATIIGQNLGAAPGQLLFSSSDISCPNPPSCVSSPANWGSEQIQATLTASANAVGTYFVQVVSAGGASGNGFQQGTPQQSSKNSNPAQFQVQLPTISGQVTLSRTNSPLSGVSISVTDSNNIPYCPGLQTDSNGRYSCPVPATGTYTVAASALSMYWFTPRSPNVKANQTQNFTGAYLLTVYILHGIGQSYQAMQFLAANLRNLTTGLDPTRFIVNAGFDFSECQNTSCGTSRYGDACSVGAGAKSLAHYIQQNPPPGDVIFIGYSMGGLIARDLIANNYPINGSQVLNAQHQAAGLITLGTPSLGYPMISIDASAFCPQLINDMAGSWLPELSPPTMPLSSYLSNLIQQWQSASYFTPWQPVAYGKYWVAAAGEACSSPVRTTPGGPLPPLQPGCLTSSPSLYSDDVVCRDSATYSSPGVALGPGPTSLFQDPSHQYVHTTSDNGLGSFLLLCGSNTGQSMLSSPPVNDPLFYQYIVGTINGN